ncbi:MAG TPA: hypothetical protein VL156_15500 [Terriglobales bacterium]|jgi:hypothetical protein|nr:hypothetical protein [Terriglobales bacterium]
MSNPPTPPSSPLPPPAPEPNHDFNIAEEYGTARKSLPPARIVGICLGAVILIVAGYSLTHRARPQSSGSIDGVFSAPMPNQKLLMIAVNISLQNNEQKPTWIKSIQVSSEVAGQKQADEAVPAVDAERYLTVLPDLKPHVLPILTPETRINPGGKISGTVLVGLPLTPEEFAARKSITVTILPYDEVAVVLTK